MPRSPFSRRPVRLRPADAVPQRRVGALALVAIVVGIAAIALGVALLKQNRPTPVAEAQSATRVPAKTVTVEPLRDPTPFVASYRSLRIHLPVDPAAVTAFAFHQAAGREALHMTSLVADADAVAVAKAAKRPKKIATAKTTTSSAEIEAAENGVVTIYQGKALRLWRSNRRGAPDTAADCGAKPGTMVYAPVTGTVIGVRNYKLYGEHDDMEVHIQPDAWPEVDCVLIHIDGVQVKVGDRVVGGVTPVATIRRLSNKVTHQLAAYTADGGDHVHMQLNRLDVPGQLPPLDGS